MNTPDGRAGLSKWCFAAHKCIPVERHATESMRVDAAWQRKQKGSLATSKSSRNVCSATASTTAPGLGGDVLVVARVLHHT